MLGPASVFIILALIAIYFRFKFFKMLQARHKEIWKTFESPTGTLDFSFKNFSKKSEFLENKKYKDLNDPALTKYGNLANITASLFFWLFGFFLIYLFIWPFIKIALGTN